MIDSGPGIPNLDEVLRGEYTLEHGPRAAGSSACGS